MVFPWHEGGSLSDKAATPSGWISVRTPQQGVADRSNVTDFVRSEKPRRLSMSRCRWSGPVARCLRRARRSAISWMNGWMAGWSGLADQGDHLGELSSCRRAIEGEDREAEGPSVDVCRDRTPLCDACRVWRPYRWAAGREDDSEHSYRASQGSVGCGETRPDRSKPGCDG